MKSFATTFHVAKVSTCRSLLSRCHALFRRLGRYQWVARFRCSFGKPTKSDEGQRKSNCLQALKRLTQISAILGLSGMPGNSEPATYILSIQLEWGVV